MNIKTTAAQAHDCKTLALFYEGLSQLPPETSIDDAVGVLMRSSKGRLNPKLLPVQIASVIAERKLVIKLNSKE